jgi:hypothetical protein
MHENRVANTKILARRLIIIEAKDLKLIEKN